MYSEKIRKYSIYKLLVILLQQISIKRRFELILLVFLMLLSSFAEIFSLTIIIPFLTILSNPKEVWDNNLFQFINPFLGYENPSDLLIPLTFIFIISSIFSALLRLSTFWFNGKLAAIIGSDIGNRTYLRTLNQPYERYISRNSSGLISALSIHINNVISFLNLSLTLISSLFILFGLIFTLIFIDLNVALIIGFAMGSAYILIGYKTNRRLTKNSREIIYHQNESTKVIQEGLGAYRDIILDRSQKIYLEIFKKSDFPLRNLMAQNNFLGAFPKFMMEAFGISLIAIIALFLSTSRGGIGNALPLLGVFALGAQKILPITQSIYNSWANIQGSKGSIEIIIFLLTEPIPHKIKHSSVKSLNFKKDIVFKNISFSYNGNNNLILKKINFNINKGEKVGIIGKTGSGKSTLIDLLMGLLEPDKGQILIDNKRINHEINNNFLLRWQACIAHVPQSVYLSDRSIAENIAFGDFKEKIDLELVKKAAKKAQISEYIESIPEKYATLVGERGIKLSGGQRQRIGIARALYKGASILVFDEATSALDNITEQKIMNTLYGLDDSLTVILIAHRLTTIQNCDKLIKLNNGQVEAIGKPDEVLKLNN